MKPFVLTLTATLCLMSWHTAVIAEPQVRFERSYVTHDWGQIHILASEPAEVTHTTPLVCFPPTPTLATTTGCSWKHLAATAS